MELIKKNSYNFLVVFLICLSLQLTSLSYRYSSIPKYGWQIVSFFISPFQKLFHESVVTTDYLWSRYIWLQGVSDRARLLEIENQELKSEKAKLIEFQYENQRLGNILNYKSNFQLKGIVSNVIGRDPSNWSMTVSIDKGLDDGIIIGAPVIDGHGLVGRISAVSNNHSVVLLLTDPLSSVGAMTQDSRITGIVEGSFSSNQLRLSYVENSFTNDIKIGESVITSGLDGIFPKGITIGTISEVKNSGVGLFQEINLTTTVEFRKLETVMILQTNVKQ